MDYSIPEIAIAKLRAAQASYHVTTPDPSVTERTVQYKNRDSTSLRIIVHSSSSHTSTEAPLIVLFHGGGSTIGSPEDFTPLARRFVSTFSAVVACPEYRLAPENPFPAQSNDAWDAVQWLALNAEKDLGVKLENGFVVGGQSAGAKLAVVTAHLARDQGLTPKLTGVWVAAGGLLSPEVVPERFKDHYLSMTQEECLDAPVLDKQFAKLTREAVKGDVHSALFVPFNWPTGHRGLPPHYFDVCGLDLVRDDALLYEKVLRDGEVDTRMTVYPGMPHLFFNYFPKLKQTYRWRKETLNGMKWLLGREGDRNTE